MKKYIKYTRASLLAALLLGASCTNLDETVYDRVTAEGTTLTAADLDNIVAPAYTSFRGIYWDWDGLHDLYEESSDLIVTPQRNGIGWGDYYINMHLHTWGATQGHAEGNWFYQYRGVNSVNRAIYQIEQLEGIEDKEAKINELRALRAIYYYLLYDTFRNIPLVTSYIQPEGFLPTQSTSQEIFTFLEKELKESLPSLSEENTSKTYGKVTKWAAKMTLAKLYLNAQVYIGTPKWAEALAEVNDIIASGKFRLADNYLDNFKIKNEDSPEEILSIPFDQIKTGGSYYVYKTLHPISQATFDLSGSPWGGSGAIPQFINTYDPSDKRLKDCFLGGLQFTSKGEPLMLDGKQFEYINYMSSVNGAEPNEGYRLVKYEIGPGDQSSVSNDVPFYRYADALFIKAECLLRTGDPAGAAALITQVRQRDFKTTDPAKAEVTGARLMGGSVYQYGTYENGKITRLEGGDDIMYGGLLDELAWEFVGEHHRKQDLIRFGVYTKKSWLTHVPKGDHRILLPIPQSQIDANKNLVQNPGY